MVYASALVDGHRATARKHILASNSTKILNINK